MKYFFLLFTYIFINTINAQSIEEFDTLIIEKIKQNSYLDADMLVDKMKENYGETPEYFLNKSKIADLLDNRDMSIEYILDGLIIHPNNFKLNFHAGKLYLNSGLIDTSINFLNNSLKYSNNYSDSFDVNLNIGLYFLFKRNYDSSKLIFNNLLKVDSNCMGCYNNLFIIYHQQKRYNDAYLIMLEALKLDSSYSTFNNIGLALSNLEKYEEAIKYIDKGLIDKPNFPYLHSNKAYCLLKLGNPKQALKEINYSISIDNKNSYAYRNRALIYLDLNLVNEACIEIEHGLKLGFEMYYGSELQELKDKYCK